MPNGRSPRPGGGGGARAGAGAARWGVPSAATGLGLGHQGNGPLSSLGVKPAGRGVRPLGPRAHLPSWRPDLGKCGNAPSSRPPGAAILAQHCERGELPEPGSNMLPRRRFLLKGAAPRKPNRQGRAIAVSGSGYCCARPRWWQVLVCWQGLQAGYRKAPGE